VSSFNLKTGGSSTQCTPYVRQWFSYYCKKSII